MHIDETDGRQVCVISRGSEARRVKEGVPCLHHTHNLRQSTFHAKYDAKLNIRCGLTA